MPRLITTPMFISDTFITPLLAYMPLMLYYFAFSPLATADTTCRHCALYGCLMTFLRLRCSPCHYFAFDYVDAAPMLILLIHCRLLTSPPLMSRRRLFAAYAAFAAFHAAATPCFRCRYLRCLAADAVTSFRYFDAALF